MTLKEKLAERDKLKLIDSSIESCFKIIRQEIEKKKLINKDYRLIFYRDAIVSLDDAQNLLSE